MPKSLLERVCFLVSHPYESIIGRIKKHYYKKKGIDFSHEFDLTRLGLDSQNSNAYESLNGIRKLKHVFDKFQISENDNILDLGCGKGEALHQLSKYPFNNLCGVELSGKLVEIAKNNLRILKHERINIVEMDAAEFTDYEDYNYIYMFNPFPANIMRKVIANINLMLEKKRRCITIVYSNPVCFDVIESSPYFLKINEYDIEYKDIGLKVYVYQSKNN